MFCERMSVHLHRSLLPSIVRDRKSPLKNSAEIRQDFSYYLVIDFNIFMDTTTKSDTTTTSLRSPRGRGAGAGGVVHVHDLDPPIGGTLFWTYPTWKCVCMCVCVFEKARKCDER